MANRIKVALVSTFGPEPRGISYYSDGLIAALECHPDLAITPIDYQALYPRILHPANTPHESNASSRTVHYAKPSTWTIPPATKPDIVHIQQWTFFTHLTHRAMLLNAKRTHTPTIITVHNPAPHETLKLANRVQNSLYRLADTIVLHDNYGLKFIPKIERHKVAIIPHGAQIKRDFAAHKDIHGRRYILFFGNIRPYKGLEVLIEAWASIHHRFPDTKLVVAGRLWSGQSFGGRVSARILGTRKLAKKILDAQAQHSDKIDFRLHFIEDTELDILISNARLAVFPYERFSGQSGAATRCASLGTPIVASKAGGLPSLIIDDSYLLPDVSAQSVAERISEKLLANDDDLNRKKQIDSIEKCSWEAVSSLHRDLYFHILRSKKH